MEIQESGAIDVADVKNFDTSEFEKMLIEFSNNLVDNTSKFNNLRELRDGGEPIYYTTFCMYRTIPKNKDEKPKVYYEFGTSTLNKLESNYNKKIKRKELKTFTYYGFYKSNNLNNCKTVLNYYVLMYRLKSDIYIANKKLESLIF